LAPKVFIIAEIAQAHEGSLGIAHSYIDALFDAGVDAVKFQIHIAEAESSSFEQFRIHFSYEDKTRFNYWKRMEFSEEQWSGLKKHCEEKGLEFIPSPFSCTAVDLLERIGAVCYKIASGEVTNLLMLEKIARTKKDIILSSGMSSTADIDNAVALIKKYGNTLLILQCTTSYPAPPEEIGLNVIRLFKERYSVSVGLSDHSGTIFAPLAAVALGAEIIEVHAVFDTRMFGPDAKSSLTIDEIATMVRGIRFIEKALSNPVDKSQSERFEEMRRIFGKSLSVNKNLDVGHLLSTTDLESKKPAGQGIAASEYHRVIGKTIKQVKKKWDFLSAEDLG
jgi:N-acetylneuraminate synthase